MDKARQQAILDIKEDLKRNHRSFLAFHRSLNPVMEYLTTEYLNQQLNITHQ